MNLDGRLDVIVTAQDVTFEFGVTNAGSESVDLEFRSGAHADVAVNDDGTEVWRWGEGRMFTQAIETETLAPGERFAHEMTWEDPPSGEYTAEAELLSTNVRVTERASFSVP